MGDVNNFCSDCVRQNPHQYFQIDEEPGIFFWMQVGCFTVGHGF